MQRELVENQSCLDFWGEIKQNNKKMTFISIIGFILILGVGIFDYKVDSRWQKLKQGFEVVFIQDNMDYLKGKILDNLGASNYERLFHIKEGLKAIEKNPLGYGYARDIYGLVISKEYNIHSRTHAHSGVIDWGIGLGIPGLLLWSIIAFYLIFYGLKVFFKNDSYYGLLVFYLTTSFYFRMFLDSINKDHYLQQFVFLVFLVFFASIKEINEKNNFPSS